jgi:hypothetical protein
MSAVILHVSDVTALAANVILMPSSKLNTPARSEFLEDDN